MDGRSRWENFRERLSHLEARDLIVPFIILLVVIGTIVGIVNYSRRRAEQEPPTIEVTTPNEGSTTEEDRITVTGKTDPDSTVSVNDRSVDVGEDGGFSTEVSLSAGDNKVRIVATNEIGKSSEAEISVTRLEKPTPTPTAGGGSIVAGPDLSRSGPETLWIPEISALSLAAASWYGSRKKLSSSIQKKQ